MMPWETCNFWARANASIGQKAALLFQMDQEGLNHPCLSDLLNAKALFQLLSLGPGRTPYSHASLLPYTAPVPRKPVPGWAQGHPRRSPGRQHPSECHLGADSLQHNQRFCSSKTPRILQVQTCTFDPQAPKARGKTPKKGRNSCQSFPHGPWGVFGRTTIA